MIYFDDGPGGPCGQSMRTTCPHASIHIWDSEDKMREDLKTMTPRNPKARMMYGVVDQWSSPGIFSINKH